MSAINTQYRILHFASAWEWDFTAQTVWWYCAVAHLRGNIGPHITSSVRGERSFHNDDAVKNIYLKFWWRNMWTRPSNNRRYSATVQNYFQKKFNSAIIFCCEFLQYCYEINLIY